MAFAGMVTEPMRPEFSSTTSDAQRARAGPQFHGARIGHSFREKVLIGGRLEAQAERLAFQVGVQTGVVALNEEDVQLVHPAARLLLHLQVAGRNVQALTAALVSPGSMSAETAISLTSSGRQTAA